MELILNGTIKVVNETQTWDSGFSKREFVVTTKEQYPQDVKFEVVKDKCSLFDDKFKVGDDVDVSFNVRGNEYMDKFYVNLQAWKINMVGSGAAVAPANALEPSKDADDDLPF